MNREELVNAILDLAIYEIDERILEAMAKETYEELVTRLWSITLSLNKNNN